MSDLSNLGPLADLVGVWYGNEGKDVFPTPPNTGPKIKSSYVETMTFSPIAPIQNGPQTLYGVRYLTELIGDAFLQQQHQETGYLLWNPESKEIIKTFAIPRGEALMASGGLYLPLEPGPVIPPTFLENEAGKMVNASYQATSNNTTDFIIYLSASAGSKCYGILNTPYLDQNFDINSFAQIIEINTIEQQQPNVYDPSKTITVKRKQLCYFEVSGLKYGSNLPEEFHTDSNTLWKQV
ncbi:heme-binding beta-barrel domain-containing protein [Marinomonas posidonica]|uniref:heme-binding beta-barrel domain-containing protein n=1 Tax=Marinomonas posidonica TaxID=936476 RepID=UPI0037365729